MNPIEKYFAGEKLQCTIGLILSILWIAVCVYFLFLQKPMLKGMAYVSIPLSVLLLSICIGIIFRTPSDIQRVTTFFTAEPQKLQTDELKRMEKIMTNFSMVKKIEIVIFGIGLLMLLLFWKNDLVKGIAVGLMLEGVVLLLFDLMAGMRAETYVQYLKSL